ncbi:MAG: site-2 protease family protein [Clostridia bacterium]|nr:site-2 protease family protein [Clostridia bacterium]
MNKPRISPFLLLLLFSYMLIEGSFIPLWVLLFSLVHEGGHLLVIRLLGGGVRSFQSGGQGFGIGTRSLSYRAEFWAAFAGPLTSLALAFLFALCEQWIFFGINLSLGLMNLLPIYPLDGGRMLRAILIETLPLHLQRPLLQGIGLLFILPLLALAFWQFLASGYNVSLLFICFYLLGLLKENGNDV